MNDLFERLAAIEHERWSDWQKYMHSLGTIHHIGNLLIPAQSVKQWERQMATPYAELSDQEKESDRDQVRRYWDLIQQYGFDAARKTVRRLSHQNRVANGR